MNRLLKNALAVLLAASVASSAVPVFARGESRTELLTAENAELYEQRSINNVFEQRGYIFNISYKLGDTDVFYLSSASDVSSLAANVSVQNNSGADAEFTVKMYAQAADGTKTELTSGEITVENTATQPKAFDTLAPSLDAVKIVTEASIGADTYKIGELEVLSDGLAVPTNRTSDFWSTFLAHDPSIVKFGDTYYAYSSHHLIFSSEDLIVWQKHDFASKNVSELSPKTYEFITANYTDTQCNGTYWAPDVIYMENDDHPYWMYISVSCGLGGRNSAISLVKSDKPLFWADAEADIIDAGVVFATRENENYKTNAIDANIYTDESGNKYFIWGSFWGGIQGAKLKEDGFVEGIDYSSDTTLLNTCKNFGKTLFGQRNTIAGPEGAWMIDNGDYRYMFTSYGWLGSNYNTRVGRSPKTDDFAEVVKTASGNSTTFADANDVKLGNITAGNTKSVTGYKLIGSYRLGDGVSDKMTVGGDGNYSLARYDGDATVYYGPGHNSVLNDDGNFYYVSHVRKNGVEGGAFLQVRRLLWTEDGWPVVSPVSYAGEAEQKLPVSMITGTYDLASVGQTKKIGDTIAARNFDLPVFSSKITLLEDGTMADELGTWEFDNDHTVTLTFAKDGDVSKDEFYKTGDVITMKALFGYDSDSGRYVTALTGIDQNHITQFAVKPLNETRIAVKGLRTEEITLEKSKGNPALGFDENGNLMYAGDPAATVIGDTVYLYAGHDTASGEGYEMPEWVLYTSKDMKNWKYNGVVLKATDISWRQNDTSAWAGQMTEYNGKYYFYFCTWDKTSSGKQSIGVAVADKPEGPFTDIGAPLVKGTFTTPESSGFNDIDPTVWIENDESGTEHRYLGWGNGKYYICELNEDMMSIKDIDGDGSITMGKDVVEQIFENMGGNVFTEAPWLYRRRDENGVPYGQYYTFFAQNWREEMGYAVSDDLSKNTWCYKGRLMMPTATSNTNHPSVIDFKGKTYFIYHNGALTHGSGFRRSVCIQEMAFDKYGNVYPIPELSVGLTGRAVLIKDLNGFMFTHSGSENSLADSDYPIRADVTAMYEQNGLSSAWEIVRGLYEGENESYVSIQSVDKPGLYIKAENKDIVLTQDADGAQAKAMTFKTLKALDGTDGGVSFESVSEPGKYLTTSYGKIMLSEGTAPNLVSFTIDENVKVSVTDQYASNGVVGFNISGGAVYENLTAYVAEYDDDKLIGVGVEKISAFAQRQAVEVKYTQKQADSTLKLFIWNGMIPLTSVNIVTASEKPVPSGVTAYFGFNDSLENSVTQASAILTGSKSNEGTDKTAAEFADGYDGRAISFTGKDSYGVKLGNVITDRQYTISFRMKANEYTAFTPAVFIDADDNGNRWHSMPMGYQNDGTMMIWSNTGGGYIDFITGTKIAANEWHNITVTADGANAVMYIDGVVAGSGKVADVIGASTVTYLAVNRWDTPFNGLIDELYIYNGTVLTAEEVKELNDMTKVD